MASPGSIFELVKKHKASIYSGAGSVLCALTNADAASQGHGAMRDPSDAEYNAADALRGLPSFTGLSYDPDTGMMVSADQAEIGIDQAEIKIGRPEKGWLGKMRNIDGTDLRFRVLDVMQDRTLGVFRIRLSILKDLGEGRTIIRRGVSGAQAPAEDSPAYPDREEVPVGSWIPEPTHVPE